MSQKASPDRRGQTRLQAAVFEAKAWFFRARRCLLESRAPRLEKSPCAAGTPLAAESFTPLRTSMAEAEWRLQEGKIRNLAVAAQHLNGLQIPAGTTFSFWRHVPRPTRQSGFVEGRELREGCIVPSVGGGLCQLSNALFGAALDAGCEIIERHPHSRIVPGSAAETGRDATVFWNYVDLRFRPRHDLHLEVVLTDDQLMVRFRGRAASATTTTEVVAEEEAASCETCGVETCYRHRALHGRD